MLHMHTVECTKATQNYWQCYDRSCSSYLYIETQSIQEYKVLEPSFLHHYPWYVPSLTIPLPSSEEICKC